MKFFSIDSPVYRFMCRFWDITKLNLCWLLCCIPIVTIGAATVAAYSVTLKMVENEEGYIARSFFKAFKENLKNGFILEVLTVLCFEVVYIDYQLFEKAEGNPVIFLIISVVSGFVFVLSLLYAYPLSARYDNSIAMTLRNSFRISMRYFGRTLMLVFVIAVEVIVFLWNEITLFFALLLGPALIFYTISTMARMIFKMIEKDSEEQQAVMAGSASDLQEEFGDKKEAESEEDSGEKEEQNVQNSSKENKRSIAGIASKKR